MKKVLVAEDDEFLMKVYKAKLPAAGFDLRTAVDGEEVFTILKEFTPDIFLLDLMMPKKDGFAVLAELKAQEQWKNIPVLVTTNLSQPADKEKVLGLGAKEYLVKSDVPIYDIVSKIKTYVGE